MCVFKREREREREKGCEIKRELEKGEKGRQREKANALFSSARESISMLLPTPSTRVDLIRQFSSCSGSHVIQCLTQKIFFCLLLKIFVVKASTATFFCCSYERFHLIFIKRRLSFTPYLPRRSLSAKLKGNTVEIRDGT